MNFMEIATQLRNREVKDVYILDERYGSADDYKQVDQAKAAITAQGLECKGVITPRDLTAFVESSEFYNRVNPISLKAHYDKKNEKGAKMAVQTYLGKIRESGFLSQQPVLGNTFYGKAVLVNNEKEVGSCRQILNDFDEKAVRVVLKTEEVQLYRKLINEIVTGDSIIVINNKHDTIHPGANQHWSSLSLLLAAFIKQNKEYDGFVIFHTSQPFCKQVEKLRACLNDSQKLHSTQVTVGTHYSDLPEDLSQYYGFGHQFMMMCCMRTAKHAEQPILTLDDYKSLSGDEGSELANHNKTSNGAVVVSGIGGSVAATVSTTTTTDATSTATTSTAAVNTNNGAPTTNTIPTSMSPHK